MVFPQPYPNNYKQRKKKKKFPSILKIIEFFSIYFLWLSVIFSTLIHWYYFGRQDIFYRKKKVKRKYNLLYINTLLV